MVWCPPIRWIRRLSPGVVAFAIGCAADPPTLPSESAGGSGTSGSGSIDGGPGDGGPGDDGTVGASAGGTGGTMGGETDSPADSGDAGSQRAFRINSARLIDPHVHHDALGDLTGLFNDQLSVWLAADPSGSGDLEAGLVFVFRPLDQADNATGVFEYWNSSCPLPDADVCTALDDTMLYSTFYETQTFGPCLAPDPEHLDPELSTPEGPADNCFVTEPFNVDLVTDNLNLPLDLAEVSAEYLGEPADYLVRGLLRGFLSNEAANEASATIEVVGEISLADVLRDADRDEDGTGWWLYFEFTALVVDWPA